MKGKSINNQAGQLGFGLVLFTKNEGRTIKSLLEESSNYIDKNDIFVIDGHSQDNTTRIVSEMGVKLFLDPKKGKGSAIRFAINNIERDILIFMDSDGSHRPEEIRSLLEPFWKDKKIDMVIGSRFLGGSEELCSRPSEIIRLMGNIIGTFLVNLRWKARLTDIQNGFRAIKRNTFREMFLSEDSFAIEQEMVMKCLQNGRKIVEVPSFEIKRRYGKSHIKPLRMLPKYIDSFFEEFIRKDSLRDDKKN